MARAWHLLLLFTAFLAYWPLYSSSQGEGNQPRHGKAARIIGLVPVRNEEKRIAFCLRALALFTDAIVVLDDCSGDGTLSVVEQIREECAIERVIAKSGAWVRNETQDRNALLEAGRSLGGTHFIVLDADEALTSNLLDGDELRSQILELRPRESIALHWIQLWKSSR
jgi:hypothetical protein